MYTTQPILTASITFIIINTVCSEHSLFKAQLSTFNVRKVRKKKLVTKSFHKWCQLHQQRSGVNAERANVPGGKGQKHCCVAKLFDGMKLLRMLCLSLAFPSLTRKAVAKYRTRALKISLAEPLGILQCFLGCLST